MTDLDTEVRIPPGVELRDGRLLDNVLGQTYPLSGSACAFLELMLQRRRLGEIATIVAERFGVEEETVATDLIQFVETLNSGHLLNVRGGSPTLRFRRWAGQLAYSVVTRSFPTRRVTRHAVSAHGLLPHLASISAILGKHTMPVWLLPAAGLLALGTLAKLELAAVLAPAILAVFLCLVVHEFGHALAIWREGAGSYVVTAGWNVAIVHSVARPAPLIHAGGPALAGAVGVCAVIVSLVAGSPQSASFAVPFLLNLAGLTVFSKDGRSLARAL
ncbi:MAG: PqqD family protein [SAR202 cluster bacterium]|nr:PqqD family protein [SAR202 cluster bacterium]